VTAIALPVRGRVTSQLKSLGKKSRVKMAKLLGLQPMEYHFELANRRLAENDCVSAIESIVKCLVQKPNRMATLALAAKIFERSNDLSPEHVGLLGVIPQRVVDLYFAEEATKVVSLDGHPDVESFLAFPEETTEVAPPKNLQEVSFYTDIRRARSPDRYVYRLSNSRVLYDDFNIAFFDASGQALNLPVSIGCQPLLCKTTANRSPLVLQGTALLLGSRGSKCYGHWILDVIATVGAIKSAGMCIEDIDHILIAGADLRFKQSILESLGLGQIPVVSSDKHPFVAATTLITADVVTNMCRRAGTWLPDFLRSHFLTQEASDGMLAQSEKSSRIYVGRAGVGRRNVANEQAIQSALAPYGFTFIEIEKYSQQEQAELFNAADVIVAPHGAALTNLAYCKSGTKVIEAYGPHIEPCFWILSNICKLDYYNIRGVSDSNNNTVDEAGSLTFSVDIEDLKGTLEYAGVYVQ